MQVKFDETQVTITKAFKEALIDVMKAECEMMAKADSEGAEVWYWGRATISDLSIANGIEFTYGGRSDKPLDGKGRFAVLAAA